MKTFLIILICIIITILLPYLFFYIYYRFCKKMNMPQSTLNKLHEPNLLKKIFILLPRRFILDKFTLNPNKFDLKGVHIFCGCQGSGKTIALTHMLMKYQSIYPNLVVKTNYAYKYEDAPIYDWHDIVDSNNGENGEIDVLDEIQNWFNSLQSKDFPVEMLQEVTQQRKQCKCIVGTSQVFMRIAKPLREQIDYIYMPKTLFGCFTIVKVVKPDVSKLEGTTDHFKLHKLYCFVHTDEIRNAFDTYKKIQMLSLSGFKDSSQHMINQAIDFSLLDND